MNTNIHTSIACANPLTGDISISASVALTTPLPFTISSPTNCAVGRKCVRTPNKIIRIKIMENADNPNLKFLRLAVSFFSAISFTSSLLEHITVPALPSNPSSDFSKDVMIALLFVFLTNFKQASTLGSILPLENSSFSI